MPVDPMMVAQGLGFLHRHLELEVEEKLPGAEQALEWFVIIESAIESFRADVRNFENRISQAKQSLK